ncbi:MAG: protoporphyrinogen oxidase [Magnetococcales bacterium]|nr:protoporphyrinogen oxidase [Magnetococcales bacterium]
MNGIPRAIIVGGGISGLSLAFFLERKGVAVTLVERTGRTGGVIRTSRSAGFLVEHGPNSTMHKPGDESDALGRLMDALGLLPRIANPAAGRRYVQKMGRLLPLPGSPSEFLKTPLFSLRGKLGLLREPFRSRGDAEESIARFVTRRLGAEFLDWAIDPFISGVYAGDPDVLSVRAAVPRIHALEERYGSLIRGAIALGRQGRVGGMPRGRLISFDDGMERLVTAVQAHLHRAASNAVRCITGVEGIRIVPLGGGQWEVRGANDFSVVGEGVFLAVPACDAAPLVAPLSEAATLELQGIRHAPVVSMALGFDRGGIGHPLDGFGYLIPRREGMDLLGCLFSSTLFPGRADEGTALLTAFAGGMRHPEVVALADEPLTQRVVAGLARALAIGASPRFVAVTRYQAAIAQYEMGHLQRVARISRLLDGWPGLYLCGNFIGGVSVADRIRNSERLADAWCPARGKEGSCHGTFGCP